MRRLLRVLPGKRLVGEAELDGRPGARQALRRAALRKTLAARTRRSRGAASLAGVPTPANCSPQWPMAGGGYALLTVFLDPAESLAEAWARVSGRAAGDGEALAVLAPALGMLGACTPPAWSRKTCISAISCVMTAGCWSSMAMRCA
ncbi:MAG: hypothetical protein V5B38_16520 [Candidatus Accumulibacter propinquus]